MLFVGLKLTPVTVKNDKQNVIATKNWCQVPNCYFCASERAAGQVRSEMDLQAARLRSTNASKSESMKLNMN